MSTVSRRTAAIVGISIAFSVLFLTYHLDATGLLVVPPGPLGPRGPITYIPFTFGFTMLLQTLRGYQFVAWPNIIIVDNSWDGSVYAERDWLKARYGVLDVVTTPVHLRFTQLQAYLDKMARDSGEAFYFWSHTDILLLSEDTGAYDRARRCIETTNASSTSPHGLGVMFIDYDRLSAVSVTAGNAVPWDPATPQYGSDCDRYARMRLAGYEVVDCADSVGSVAHLHAVMTDEEQDRFFSSDMSLEARINFTNALNANRSDYAWRFGVTTGHRDAITMTDSEALRAEVDGGTTYMKAKWGPGWTCELDGLRPAFDVPTYEGL